VKYLSAILVALVCVACGSSAPTAAPVPTVNRTPTAVPTATSTNQLALNAAPYFDRGILAVKLTWGTPLIAVDSFAVQRDGVTLWRLDTTIHSQVDAPIQPAQSHSYQVFGCSKGQRVVTSAKVNGKTYSEIPGGTSLTPTPGATATPTPKTGAGC